MNKSTIPGFRTVARTGVIYVMRRALDAGFSYEDKSWANLGQGSPETGVIEGAPARVRDLRIDPASQKYAPVPGNQQLRQAVADMYNRLYRYDKSSQYTWENVSIAGGGRLALTRLAATLGNINMGHFLPDYTAYEELLSVFKAFIPIPILLDRDSGYRISVDRVRDEILGRGLRALLISNPCNPTGQLIQGDELRAWVDTARECECSVIMDEFYSHYIYEGNEPSGRMVSAARYVEDVNRDPVIVVDGVTKNWRYPGWRISWTLGPAEVIDAVGSAGSFLDGGANHPFQSQVLDLLGAEHVQQETAAIQRVFAEKKRYTVQRLREMGIRVNAEPAGTFYVWADLSGLPEALRDGMRFFEAGLAEKVITVPGVFFDVNPSGRRIRQRRYTDHCRVSFGADQETLKRGLDALERVIDN